MKPGVDVLVGPGCPIDLLRVRSDAMFVMNEIFLIFFFFILTSSECRSSLFIFFSISFSLGLVSASSCSVSLSIVFYILNIISSSLPGRGTESRITFLHFERLT